MEAGSDTDKTEILICSCDKYQDVWPAFFTLFFRYWPDCPFRINLLANQRSFPDPRVKTLHTPAEADWSTTFQMALRLVEGEYVLVTMEDYLLDQPVDTARLRELIAIMMEHGAVCVHLGPDPRPEQPLPGANGVGIVVPGQAFRVNLQTAVWQRSTLLDLVVPGESAWDFEVVGTKRSVGLEAPFLSLDSSECDSPFHYYRTGVVRGKWMPGAVRLCQREGIAIDTRQRPVGWVRGLVRDTPALRPLREGFVWVKRRLGKN
ncbi:MAG TPA: hypothetical protein PLU22_09060 [Polyangiaceae bacterium]|nr:hypothetical protein [Polyangiaceae bacterium]